MTDDDTNWLAPADDKVWVLTHRIGGWHRSRHGFHSTAKTAVYTDARTAVRDLAELVRTHWDTPLMTDGVPDFQVVARAFSSGPRNGMFYTLSWERIRTEDPMALAPAVPDRVWVRACSYEAGGPTEPERTEHHVYTSRRAEVVCLTADRWVHTGADDFDGPGWSVTVDRTVTDTPQTHILTLPRDKRFCYCGNVDDADGFSACDRDGWIVSDYMGYCLCSCGRIIDDAGAVVGRNPYETAWAGAAVAQ